MAKPIVPVAQYDDNLLTTSIADINAVRHRSTYAHKLPSHHLTLFGFVWDTFYKHNTWLQDGTKVAHDNYMTIINLAETPGLSSTQRPSKPCLAVPKGCHRQWEARYNVPCTVTEDPHRWGVWAERKPLWNGQCKTDTTTFYSILYTQPKQRRGGVELDTNGHGTNLRQDTSLHTTLNVMHGMCRYWW